MKMNMIMEKNWKKIHILNNYKNKYIKIIFMNKIKVYIKINDD